MRITIKDLRFDAIMGIHEFERTAKQPIIVHAQIDYAYQSAQFIDYKMIAEIIEERIKLEKFELIEEALQALCEILKKNFDQIEAITLCIEKPSVLQNGSVGVSYSQTFDTTPIKMIVS